jgi:type II secretory pathway pseudopilin PulG
MRRDALSLVEVMVASTIIGATAVLFAAAWSGTEGQARTVRLSRAASSLIAQQSALIRRKVRDRDTTPWDGPTGPLDGLRKPAYRTWSLKLDRARRRYDVEPAAAAKPVFDLPATSDWYLMNPGNIGAASEPVAVRADRLATARGLGLDVVVRAVAVAVVDETGAERPAPTPDEPRDAALWQIEVLSGGERLASSQFLTWWPVHLRAGEPP